MNIDIIPNGAIKRVHVSQNDVGRTLTFELFNNSTSYEVPSGATVKIQGTKPSGLGFSETCTVSGNVATIDTTEAMTDESGNIQTELSISYDDVVIGTSNFVLAVERNPHPSNTTDGTQITAQSLQAQIDDLRDEIESVDIETDTTLSVSGKPADAKAVGLLLDNSVYKYTIDKSISTSSPFVQNDETNWSSAIVPCTEGDVFMVKGYGGNSTRLWFFSDSEGNVLTQSDSGLHIDYYVKIVSPANASYLSVNSKYTNIEGSLVKGTFIRDELKVVGVKLDGDDSYQKDLIKSVGWSFGSIGSDGSESSYQNRIKSDFIDVSIYDSITFNIDSGYKYSLTYYYADKSFGADTPWKTQKEVVTLDRAYKYMRVILANTGNTNCEIQYVEHCTCKGNLLLRAKTNAIEDEINSDEITLNSWKIGYVYANGGVDITGQPQYVCTCATQTLPFDIFVSCDIGYQFVVRFYENGTPSSAVGFTRGSVFVPKNTPFVINMSKVPLENVADASDYSKHIHLTKADKGLPYLRKPTLKVAILGDSISSYSGISETTQSLQSPYYPVGDVTSDTLMWWHIVAEYLNAESIAVSAISRSAYYDYSESAYPPMYTDDRITRLGTNGEPDIIFVNAGTNDGFVNQNADLSYEYDVTVLSGLTNSTMKGIALTIRKLQVAYPNAKIVMMIPKQVKLADMVTGYDNTRVCRIASEIAELSAIHGVYKVIDLRKCGINQSNVASYMQDGSIHPNALGMRYIAQYIIDELTN